MTDKLQLTFPVGLVMKVDMGDYQLVTDYPEERGGNNISYNPWRVFLSSLIACQGVTLARYCREHEIAYQDISLELEAYSDDVKNDPHPEYQVKINLPENFPKEHIEPMVLFANDCPVVNHLTKLKPIITTTVNGEEINKVERS